MTRREAKRLVLETAAASIEADVDAGTDVFLTGVDGDPLSPADEGRVRRAAEELAASLRARAERLRP